MGAQAAHFGWKSRAVFEGDRGAKGREVIAAGVAFDLNEVGLGDLEFSRGQPRLLPSVIRQHQ